MPHHQRHRHRHRRTRCRRRSSPRRLAHRTNRKHQGSAARTTAHRLRPAGGTGSARPRDLRVPARRRSLRGRRDPRRRPDVEVERSRSQAGRLSRNPQNRTPRRSHTARLPHERRPRSSRAKVHLIAISATGGDPDSIDWIMVNGLTSSGNQPLQLNLLQQAWRDPQNIPTWQLHTALQQARELALTQTVTGEPQPWSTSEGRHAQSKEFQADLNDLIATLPVRTEENRAASRPSTSSRPSVPPCSSLPPLKASRQAIRLFSQLAFDPSRMLW